MSAVAALTRNLDDQLMIYRRLLDLSQNQLVAVKAQDVQTVHAVMQEIENAMLERSQVDVRRSAAIEAVATEAGIPAGEVTASLLAELAGPAAAAGIKRASMELRAIVSDLDVVVAQNAALLNHELELIDFMVRGITTAPTPNTYGHKGAELEPAALKILDTAV